MCIVEDVVIKWKWAVFFLFEKVERNIFVAPLQCEFFYENINIREFRDCLHCKYCYTVISFNKYTTVYKHNQAEDLIEEQQEEQQKNRKEQ